MSSISATAAKLKSAVSDEAEKRRTGHRVTVVGCGAVGLAGVFSLVNQGIASEIVLIDAPIPALQEKLRGEIMDLQHGLAFGKPVRVTGGSDYALTAGSDVVIITAGARQNPGESRLALVGRNLSIFKQIVPQVAAASPHAIIIVVSNPVDIMTHIAQKLSGFPASRVFGTGTSLDTSRFRTLIAEKLGVATNSVHGMIVGEHGDSSVAIWSQLNVGGIRVRDVSPDIGTSTDPDGWPAVHKQVINAAQAIIAAKGYTSWAIGLTIAHLTVSVLRDEHRVSVVSVPLAGRYGITDDVCLSLPAVIARDGIRSVLSLPLEPEEADKFAASAAAIAKVQAELDYSVASN